MPEPRVADPIQRGERGGIPLLWLEASGEPQVALVFRVGFSDEPYARSGLTHLAEHLALDAVGEPTHPHNGWVSLDQTAFTAQGTAAELVTFLQGVVRGLATLGDVTIERLDAERAMLATEAAAAGVGSVVANLLERRYGFQAPARRELVELGLRTVTAASLRTWAEAHFTREAAVLCWIGPEPPQFDLPLPRVGAGPAVLPPPQPVVPLPAVVDGDDDGLAMAVTLPRSIASSVLRLVLRRRLQSTLRGEHGLLYGIDAVSDTLAVGLTHLAFSAQTRPGGAPEALEFMLAEFSRLAQDGPTADELSAARREIEHSLHDHDTREPMLVEAALQLLTRGEPLDDVPSLLAELAAVTPAAVQQLADAAQHTLLVPVPPTAPTPGPPFRHADHAPGPPAIEDGQTFHTRALRRSSRASVTIGDRGVTVRPLDEEPRTIEYADVVVATLEPDGSLHLSANDGSWFELELSGFKDSDEIHELIYGHLDPEVLVPPAGHEHVDQVQAAAQRDLRQRWIVRDELLRLPAQLEPGEQVRMLVGAYHGKRPGLLAATDRRALFVAVTLLGNPRVHDVRHAVSRGASSVASRLGRHLGGHSVTVETQPEPRKYWGISRRDSAVAMAELLDELAGG